MSIPPPDISEGKSDLWRWAHDVHHHLFPDELIPIQENKVPVSTWSNHEEPAAKKWKESERNPDFLINRLGIQWPKTLVIPAQLEEIKEDNPELFAKLSGTVATMSEQA